MSGTYDIYAGGAGSLEGGDWDDAPYYCAIDAVTGEMKIVYRDATRSEREQEKINDEADTRTEEERMTLMDEAARDPEFERRAIEFVTEKYLRDGQQIIITFIDGVQWAFRGEGSVSVVLDCYVTVKPGTSYCLRMGYPGYGVEIVTAFSEEAAANEPVFDVEWVTSVKEAQKERDALPTTPTPPLPERTPMSDEAILAMVREKTKTEGFHHGYPDPEDPNTFIDEKGYIVYIDPTTGKEIIMVDPPKDFQRAFALEEFSSQFRSYEEYKKALS